MSRQYNVVEVKSGRACDDPHCLHKKYRAGLEPNPIPFKDGQLVLQRRGDNKLFHRASEVDVGSSTWVRLRVV